MGRPRPKEVLGRSGDSSNSSLTGGTRGTAKRAALARSPRCGRKRQTSTAVQGEDSCTDDSDGDGLTPCSDGGLEQVSSDEVEQLGEDRDVDDGHVPQSTKGASRKRPRAGDDSAGDFEQPTIATSDDEQGLQSEDEESEQELHTVMKAFPGLSSDEEDGHGHQDSAGSSGTDESDEEDGGEVELDGRGSDDEKHDALLEVERKSRALDRRSVKMTAEARAEAHEGLRRDIVESQRVLGLAPAEASDDEGGDDEEGERKTEEELVSPQVLKERIESVVEVLGDFQERRDPGLARTDYMERLAKDLKQYYGYLRELIDTFLMMFSPVECVEFLDASDKPRPLVIRANTLKTRRKDLAEALIKRGVGLEPVAKWSKVGLKITESQIPIGATPEYLAGHYMLQSAASMCPVMALAPQQGERVLDMSAAPGGKSTYISQLMRNTGIVIANDLRPQRQRATVANLHRLGVRNALVCCHDGRKIPFKGMDRVLLDAPCSGLGVISRDQSVKIQRTIRDIQRSAHLQKELLCAAVDAVSSKSSTGGIIVYSTCSVSVAENEQMVHLGCVYVLGSVELPPNIYGERFEAASALRYIREVMRILRM